ncbi:unnamed protein product [Ambrosiozyma monospora]|uniref:Unnamed protein product n=1 Tax=Ambrosiozyma monospora TaxID=43982 RepID=A0ACB5SZZ3_AMBMO|nr:unnamed protein product [Ambrosiozyma monospora]
MFNSTAYTAVLSLVNNTSLARTGAITLAKRGFAISFQKHYPEFKFLTGSAVPSNKSVRIVARKNHMNNPKRSLSFSLKYPSTAVLPTDRFYKSCPTPQLCSMTHYPTKNVFSRPMATLAHSKSNSKVDKSSSIEDALSKLSSLLQNDHTGNFDWKERIPELEHMNVKQYSLFLSESAKMINKDNKALYKNWYKSVLSLPSLHVVNQLDRVAGGSQPVSKATLSEPESESDPLMQSLRPLMFEQEANDQLDNEYFTEKTHQLLSRISSTFNKISYEDALYISASTLNPEYRIIDGNSADTDYIKVADDYLVKDVRMVLEQMDHEIATFDGRAAEVIPEYYKSKGWAVEPTINFSLTHCKHMLMPILVQPYSIARLTENDGHSARTQSVLRKLFSYCLAYAKDTVVLTDGFDLTVYKFNFSTEQLKTMIYPIGDGKYGEAYVVNYQYKTFKSTDPILTPKWQT